MDEKTRKLVDRHTETLVKLAQSQAHNAIGETVEGMHVKGVEITKSSLIAALLAKAHAPQAKPLERVQYEHAAQLLGWQSEPEA